LGSAVGARSRDLECARLLWVVMVRSGCWVGRLQ
jgi:hypothetical protein